ncbi:Sas10 C-terminal domain-containing protein [Flagelloscypha sp. PMI_526]|nr:Sas10 C-terminal domain-containing protein [Flagelloscypha sp. PMI_526]
MVRRRRTNNNKAAGPSKPRPVDRKDASVKKWEKYTDIPMDDEDEFHSSKDKILLDDADDEIDPYGNEDEVFSLKGVPGPNESDDEDDDEQQDSDVSMEEAPKKSSKKSSQRKKKKSKQDLSESEQESSEEEHWGKSKSVYYNSNAAELDSDDEEGQELELQENRRIQAKHLSSLTDEDYGLEGISELSLNDDDALAPSIQTNLPLLTDKNAILRHMEKTSPETLALARDWDEVARSLVKRQKQIQILEATKPDTLSLGMIHIHYQALLTYATTLAFYFHLRSSEKYSRKPELLNSHPILERLLTLKQSLATLEQLDFAADSEDEDEDDLDQSESDDLDLDGEEDLDDDMHNLWREARKQGLEPDELAELMQDAQDAELDPSPEPEEAPRPKKKRKTSKTDELPIFDVEEPDFSTLHSSSAPISSTMDVFGESSTLSTGDAADKAARKKSLRFYTSKLDSAASKRAAARTAIGGDDDIPYKERRREKEIREAKEAEKRKKAGELGMGGMDLDDEEPVSRADDGEGSKGDDDLYEKVRKESKRKKADKKAKYDEAVAVAKEAHYSMDSASPGPRALTKAIIANKGLTPRRSKAVRNPRVKKRMNYEKASRKVASQKAVYKGGLKDTGGRYDGERTGISKVVKGVRLG